MIAATGDSLLFVFEEDIRKKVLPHRDQYLDGIGLVALYAVSAPLDESLQIASRLSAVSIVQFDCR